jgi:hypothetical protein
MKQIAALLLASAAFITHSSATRADEPSVAYSFGARAGGYGFRNTEDPQMGQWDDCRMDGAGIFGQRTFTRHLFAEVGFDLYTARDAVPVEGMPDPMDRISGITTVAGGARVPWRWVQPYVQLGVGLEVTRVEMPEHDLSDRAVYPMGFLGVGAELWPTEHLSLGANVRTNMMKHFDHGDGRMTGEFEAAAQGQLFLKYQI